MMEKFTVILVFLMIWLQTAKGACPVGHYCPTPGEEIPCPAGFFNPNTDSTNASACSPCTPGSYCATSGLASPTGLCSPGWFCSGYDVTPTPIGKPCWKGHYCPAGSTSPLACPVGRYQGNVGQSSCSNCPASKYCWEPALIEPWSCDDGYFCNENSVTPRENLCSHGRYCLKGTSYLCPLGYRNKLQGLSQCQPCGVTVYCAYEGKAYWSGKCSNGFYCIHNETEPAPPDNICRPGHFCKNGQNYPCPAGSYQPDYGQTTCITCPAGKFCEHGAINPTDCGLGMCCHPGFISNSTCHQGDFLHLTYTAENRPTFDEANAACKAQGYYMLAVIDTAPEYDRILDWFHSHPSYSSGLPVPVWLGAYWQADGSYRWRMCNVDRPLLWGSWADGENQNPGEKKCLVMDEDFKFRNAECSETYNVLCEKCNNCTQGSYFSETTDACVHCDLYKYCPQDGLFAPAGTCDPGFKCNYWARNPHQIPCLPTHYCLDGLQMKCPKGTYNERFRQSACKQCYPGSTCSRENLQFPDGLCGAGVYCLEGAASSAEDGITCPVGHKCPTGSSAPIPCEPGTYQDETGQGACKLCPEDFYCDTPSMTTPIPCPALMFCQKGTGAPVCDDSPYQAGDISVSISCVPACGGPVLHNVEDIQFSATCSDCTAPVSSYTWSIRQCMSPGLSQCHHCRRNIHFIDNNNSPAYLFKIKWTHFDITGWSYYALVVEVELSNGDIGMAYTTWEYFVPLSDSVICTISPDNGQPFDTMFEVTCGTLDSGDYTVEYQIYTENDLLGQAPTPTLSLQLPEANSGNELPLYMVAAVNNQQYYTSESFTVSIYPPVHGGYSNWGEWDACTVTCGTGQETRTRSCTNPAPQYGGNDCVGSDTDTRDCLFVCPVDGVYTTWGAWGACTKTCDTGQQTRTRSCTDPPPQYGGSDCVGSDTETQDCITQNCPINGGYTTWGSWSVCTLTCGTGQQDRTRSCTNPAPQYGGSDCVGSETDTQDCNTQFCPIDGGYTDWGSWDVCTKTCGTGQQTRTRSCTNPAPQYGGSDCVGSETETQDCNTNFCPIDGGYTDWGAWDACTLTCGTGQQDRTRSCTNPAPQYGGSDCVGSDTETQNCNTQFCPIDGAYTNWGSWDVCTKTCGTGQQTRTRSCTNPAPQYGGSDCVGSETETQDCNTNFCPIDGGYTAWGSWGACTLTCGTGQQDRTRSCTNPAPQYGGSDCVGSDTETQNCNTQFCPIDGGYTNWGSWDVCTKTCGTGQQTRSRSCTNPAPQYGGSDCVGNDTDTQDCNTQNCPIDGGFTNWGSWGVCTKTCGTGQQIRTRSCTNPAPQYGGSDCVGSDTETQNCNSQFCPIDGGYTDWGSWDVCTKTCGTGQQTRTRSCTNPAPQYGGNDCLGSDTDTQDCNTQNCPIDGGYTNWGSWGICTKTCGTGQQTRTRSCTNPAPQYGGNDCVGNDTDTQDCITNPCSIDGGYTDWSSWDVCTKTCGTGQQTRTRSCTNPAPQYGGNDCMGNDTDTQDCNTNPCPIDGGFTNWGSWGVCTQTCGTGQQTRSRSCTNPAPQYGGSDCVGSDTDTQDCNTNFCPIDGGYTTWGAWGVCTKTCGTGQQTRTRSCTHPAPQYGGSDCVGSDTDTQDCNTQNCPIDGGYTTWGPWNECSLTCGTGQNSRTRTCTNPAPQYGGSDCVGSDTDTQDCLINYCPVDGGFTNWSGWGVCTKTCGTGQQTRTRSCSNPTPQFGGNDCLGSDTDTQDCNTQMCPVDGGYANWGAWSECPVTCGTGQYTRNRTCTNPVPQYGGKDCPGNDTDIQDCNTNPCPVDGGLTNWSSWGVCTKTCGTGQSIRTRTCTNPAPQYGGSDCVGSTKETLICNTQICPVDGGYTNWGAWSECPVTCGTGQYTRNRTCTNPVPQYGGKDCQGSDTDIQDCNTNYCSPPDPYEVGSIDIDFSCQPMCTSMMSTASEIKIIAICTNCVAEVQSYTWTLRQCDGYDVNDCLHYEEFIHYLDYDGKMYSFNLTNLPYNFTGWTYYSIFVKVTLTDGQQGMTHHIWKFFDPAPAPVNCSIDPLTGISLSTSFSTTCEEVETPETYNISYSLHKDESLMVLLYKEQTPNMNNIFLPTGFMDGQNNLHLQMVARIQGHRFYKTQIVVQVKSRTLDEMIGDGSSKGKGGGITAADTEIESGDVLAAIQRLETVAETLNRAVDILEDTQKDNSTSTDPGGENELAQLIDDTTNLVEYRTQVTKSVAKINITSYEIVSGVTHVLNHVTKKMDHLSQEASFKYQLLNTAHIVEQSFLEIATDTYNSLAENLVEKLASTDEEIPNEEVTNTAGSILDGASSMIDFFTGPVTKKPIKVIERTKKLLKTVDRVCDAMLDRQIEDNEPTIIATETVKVTVQKLASSKLSKTKINLGSLDEGGQASSFTLPENLGLSNTTKSVSLQTILMKENPYTWSFDTSTQVKTGVISISLKDSSNNVVNVTKLPEPIKLSIPATLDTSVPEYLRLKLLVKKQGDKNSTTNYTLDSLPYHTSIATFNFSVGSKKVVCLNFKLPTNLTNIKLYMALDKTPNLEEIQTEGLSYPEDISTFLEQFAGYMNVVSNSSNIYFASNTAVLDEQDLYRIYAGVSVHIDQNETLQFLADLDPDCVGNPDIDVCDGFIETEVVFHTFTVECVYWKEDQQSWSSEGCKVSSETKDGVLVCECDHLTAFGGSILALPASIDPVYDLKLNMSFFDNPVVITTLIIIWNIYVLLVLWARKADKQDNEQVGLIQCRDSTGTLGSHSYLLCIVTGWWAQAGTTANVFIYIKGSLGKSSRFCLTSSGKRCFQNGGEDWFQITTNYSLGDLRSVTLWHDNSGSSPSWFLNQVYVKDEMRDCSWMFICNDWLALDKGYTKLTKVTIGAIGEEELRFRQKYHFFVKTTKDLRDGHIWLSIFSKSASSSFTRVQRLTCCLSILLSTMLTNIMFYGIPTDNPEDQLSAGAFRLSLSQLVIGIKSSLLMFPVNFVIIQLFLRTQTKPITTKKPKKIEKCPHQMLNKHDPKSSKYMSKDPQTIQETVFLNMTRFSQSDFPQFDGKRRNDLLADRSSLWLATSKMLGKFGRDLIHEDYDLEENSTGINKDRDDKGFENEDQKPVGCCRLCKAKEKCENSIRKRKQILPWWCIYIAWTIVMTSCIVSSYFVALYGLKFGYVRSKEWLVSFLTGLVHSTFIQEPVKAIAMAILLTLILKKSVEFEDIQPDVEEDVDEELIELIGKGTPIHEPYVEPLSPDLLKQIKERLRIEWLMDMTIRDMVMQIVFLVILLVVVHSHRPITDAYMSNLTIKNLYVNSQDGIALKKVRTPGAFYEYMITRVVPAMEDVSNTDRGNRATLGCNHYLVGPYRLRQLRVKQDLCADGYNVCNPAYEFSKEDTAHYGPGWVPTSSNSTGINNLIPASSHWLYNTSWQLKTLPLAGYHATYSGAGYVLQMPKDATQQQATLEELQISGWLDGRTRAVFLEFTLYNPGVDLFSVVVIIFEFTNLGVIFPTHFIFTTSLYHYIDDQEMFVLICELLFVAINFVNMYIQYKKYKRLGRKKYLQDVWSCVEVVQIILSFSVLGLFIQRYITVETVLSDLGTQEEKFINIYPAVWSDFVLEYVMAFLVSLVILKTIKVLRFHWKPRMVSKTLSYVHSSIFHFLLVLSIVVVAYSLGTYLFFQSMLYMYRNVIASIITNFMLILREGNFQEIQTAYGIMGPLFVIMFTVTVTFCLVTVYAAILNIGRIETADRGKEGAARIHVHDYLKNRLKMFISLK